MSLGGAHKMFFSPWAADVGSFSAGITFSRCGSDRTTGKLVPPRTETGMLLLDSSIARANPNERTLSSQDLETVQERKTLTALGIYK